jgi:predicted GNAT superfamily acetyltransferase
VTVDHKLGLVLDDEITIRRAESIADYRACQDAQRRAWEIADEGYVVPVATMVGANLHGGLVLGAFLPGGESAALSFAFLGRVEGRLCLYSQLTGVVPEYQSRGLGYKIKQFQRAIARSEAIELIVWAFDPLQGGNAHFNLGRLGATSRRYIENMYGERTDSLNAGVPTDRLIVEWETRETSPVRIGPGEVAELPRLIDTRQGEVGATVGDSGAPIPTFLGMPAAQYPRLMLEIPEDIGRLRRESPATAESWRQAVSHAFRASFAAGYRAVGFVRDESPASRRSFYVLDKTSD